jgi:VCBS repeat protein
MILTATVAAAVTLHATRLPVGRSPGSVVAVDVNGDRRPDLVVANQGSGNVSVLLGDGRGGFRPAPGSPFAAGPHPNDIATGDFNADGKPDLAFPNHDTPFVTVLLGQGRGGFAPAPGSPVTVDSRPHPHGLAAADFDGDGKLDLVVESWQIDRVELLFGDGKGRFASPGPQFPTGRMPYQRVRAGDVDGDGRADVITTNTNGSSLTVLLGNGRTGLDPARGSPITVAPSPFAMAVGDVDGDGRRDLAVGHFSGQLTNRSRDAVTILLGDGKGGFAVAAGSPFPAGHAPIGLALGDVDGDGRADLAVANFGGGDVMIFRGDGQGRFSPAGTFPVGGAPAGIAVADLDGDGRADVVSADSAGDQVTVLLSRATVAP